ncbi:MAG: aldolase/citrate lyase family protein [Longimicrobiales bacterium]|nr:aldolase/citrate lyase family protein [Longimicrobiales bacterium]
MNDMKLARDVKDRLARGEASIGSWMSMAHVSIAEIVARAGYDWVVVETEHTAIDVSEVLPLLIAIERHGAVPMVRLAWNDPIQAKAVLDSGAAGVLVPMVNTCAEAEAAVRAVRFPPIGTRGVGLARAQGYGLDFAEYVERANDDVLLMIQIEHKDAVENIDEILEVEGIDGTFIGPYDMSMSMGIPGQLDDPRIAEAMDTVLKATRAKGLIAGIHLVHPDTAVTQVADRLKEGYQFIALGTDILFLGDACRDLHDRVRRTIDGGA